MADTLDAATSDPVSRGTMKGFPPADDQIIRREDGSSGRFPGTRWAFSHQRELAPTACVRRGPGAPAALPGKLRADLDDVAFTTLDGVDMTWGQSLSANFTDGILVLHRGAIVYEKYFGALEPHLPHIAYSVTKSFTGLLAAMLVHEGAIDAGALAARYVPELKDTAYGDATVRQIMDMTIGVDYSETYTDPHSGVAAYATAAGLGLRPADYRGPGNIFAFLRQLKKSGKHGEVFAYKTCNTEVLGWIIQRVTQTSLAQLLSDKIWRRLGAEEDAYLLVDSIGSATCGAGLNLTLRDLARVGEMMRGDGVFNGQQIVAKAVVADIRGGANRDHFARAGYETLPGWSYRNQWWVSHNHLGAYSARGIHGQVVYVAPGAEMVIARFASHPVAANGNGPLDRVSLPAYTALGDHLASE